MKLIDLEMLRIANQSKEGHPRGCPWGCGEEGPPIVLGPYVSQSLTLGGPCLRTRAWVRMLGHGPGCSIWESQAFKLRVTRSASMLRSINEWPSENGEGGRRDGGRRWEKWRKGVGGVSGREKTVKPWENGGWDLFLQDNRDWPMKMHPSQGH